MNNNDQFLSACVGNHTGELRDEFAKIIMAGLVTPDLVGYIQHNEVAPELIAKSVYAIADALMKERVESMGSVRVEVKSSFDIMEALSRSKSQ